MGTKGWQPQTCVRSDCSQPAARDSVLCKDHRSQLKEGEQRRTAEAPMAAFASLSPQTGPATGMRAIVCPHCGVQGKVTTRQVKQKKGISGGKATGAVFTLGWSMLATGLSRKERATEMHCGQCGTIWHV